MYKDHSLSEIDFILAQSQNAFLIYKNYSLKQRSDFMHAIASAVELKRDELVETAHAETNLSVKRLHAELKRTIFQLNSYAIAAQKGTWLGATIDTADGEGKPDLRKMLVPLGPVVVFGASNFPFAYSTAGGDTACALAAGCPVIVKAHPAHAKTSTLMANVILSAAKECKMPDGIFAHVYGADFEVGEYLVKHELVKAVGFTGSYKGGRALFDLANQRDVPIPVFAEMSSINPVFLLTHKLTTDHRWLAEELAKSITQDMGQYCTNPGLVIAVKSEALDLYVKQLLLNLNAVEPAEMLHEGIAENYNGARKKAIGKRQVSVLYESETDDSEEDNAIICIAKVAAADFLKNESLKEEVFGPYSLLIECNDEEELMKVAQNLQGQLTTTLMATAVDLMNHSELINLLKEKCGRFVLNNVPTGVAVKLAMQHGGPFPSSTDSRFTAVGADGIKRFARPITFQNWEHEFLPEELQDENPLKVWRTVNDQLANDSI